MIESHMRALILFLAVLTGCTRYEYQEDLYLEVDGSGEIRVSCSKDIFTLLYGTDEQLDDAGLADFWESPELQVVSVSRSRRQGRDFLFIRSRFEDVNRLSDRTIFQGRRYQLEAGEESLTLTVNIQGGRERNDKKRFPNGRFRFRIHFPSPVRNHNSETGVERGNIITWEQPVVDHLEGEPFHIEARFDRRTVFSVTLTLLAIALGVVVLTVSASLYIVVRIGRRQLAAQTGRPGSSTPG
jgi:hypothetical protein